MDIRKAVWQGDCAMKINTTQTDLLKARKAVDAAYDAHQAACEVYYAAYNARAAAHKAYEIANSQALLAEATTTTK
jgi:hypothetical protein